MLEGLKEGIKIRADLYNQLLTDQTFNGQFNQVLNLLLRVIRGGNKILIFGNGGSAAEAQHFAAELVGRFQKSRGAIAAIALTTDTSNLTALGNDFGFDYIFSRQIEALCQPGDAVIGFTTSDAENKKGGHSENILQAFLKAGYKHGYRVGFFSLKTHCLSHFPYVDAWIVVPSKETAVIQEVHQMIFHELCKKIEEKLF